MSAAIVSALIGRSGATSAADTQAQAAQNATNAQLQMFNQQQGNLAPWQQTGRLALGDLQSFMGLGGPTGVGAGGAGTAPGVSQFQYNPANDPMQKFMLQQGSEAIANQRSALGGVNSGATLKALSDYGQATAASSYQNEFNNWNTQLNNIFNRLSGVSGTGANTAGGMAGLGMQAAGQVGSNILSAGNVQAAGQIGQANAISGGIQGFMNSPFASNLFGQQSAVPQSVLNMANASSDPIASMNAQMGWTGTGP